MQPSRVTTVIILLAVFSLLNSATSPAAAHMLHQAVALENRVQVASETEETDEDDSGWLGGTLDTIVDTGGDVVGEVTDTTGNGAGAVWEIAEEAPGTVWDGAKSAPGTVWDGAKSAPGTVWDGAKSAPGTVWDGAKSAPGTVWDGAKSAPGTVWQVVQDAWAWISDKASGSVEWGGWANFIAQYPLLGAILGPLVLFLVGLSPDGTISYSEIALGVALFLVPGMQIGSALGKAGPTLNKMVPKLWDEASQMRRNPDGLVNGVIDSWHLLRAPAIRPIKEEFVRLPMTPGVYIVRDEAGSVIYVGMSSKLGQRVPSHFSPPRSAFADRTENIKIVETDSVTSALALECRLIKQFDPHFNTQLKNPNKPCPIFTEALSPISP